MEFVSKQNGHPEGWPFCRVRQGRVMIALALDYRSFLRQLMRSPRVVVELETGALWVVSL